jgi:hypothetical protein
MFAEGQDSQESRLLTPLKELLPRSMLQELNQDGSRNDGVRQSAVGYKGCAVEAEWIDQTKPITQCWLL